MLYLLQLCGTTYGTVFELTPNLDGTWTENVLYTFTGPNGENPAGPALDAQGNLYGGTMGGGTYGCGNVFELSPNPDGTWTESTPHSFSGGPDDGCHYTGSPILDAAGNLYGATYWGGEQQCEIGCGVAFKLAPNSDGSWTESLLYRFQAKRDGANPAHDFVFDAAGNLYGATFWGTTIQTCGTTCGSIYELTPNPNGTWKTQIPHAFTGGKDGATPFGNLAVDAAGNLYGTTLYGGSFGYGTIFKLVPKTTGGWEFQLLHTFPDKPAANPDSGVILDAAGNLYGTTTGDGSTSFGTVYEITP